MRWALMAWALMGWDPRPADHSCGGLSLIAVALVSA